MSALHPPQAPRAKRRLRAKPSGGASRRRSCPKAPRGCPLSYVGVNDGETAGQTVLYDLGNFLAIATTGKRVSFSGSVIFRVAAGKIVERWAQLDNLSLLQQLDAIPRARQSEEANPT